MILVLVLIAIVVWAFDRGMKFTINVDFAKKPTKSKNKPIK